ncbi:MAG: hypothetical protein RR326_10020 [Stenotrophomonas sp.]
MKPLGLPASTLFCIAAKLSRSRCSGGSRPQAASKSMIAAQSMQLKTDRIIYPFAFSIRNGMLATITPVPDDRA